VLNNLKRSAGNANNLAQEGVFAFICCLLPANNQLRTYT